MPDIPYRMLAVDLDGTLTNSRKELTPRTLDAVHRAIDAGVHLVLASGRPLVGVAPVADELGLDTHGGYVLANNGALIVDWKSKLVVEDLLLPRSAVEISCMVAREFGVQAICYDDTQAYSENPDDPYVEQERFNNSSVMNRVDDLTATITWEPNKMMVVGEPDVLQGVKEKLSMMLAGLAEVIASEPYFLEVVPEGVGKDIGLMKLGGILCVPRTETVAIGDGYNDIPMLEYAGLAVAMENAYDGVKPHADWVCPSNDDDGVAAVIDERILVNA